jgi:three-Cys-motif partner protein
MQISPENFLLDQDDGLPLRESKQHTLRKLRVVSNYMELFTKALQNTPWHAKYYIDLQAGPGKNRIGNRIIKGSPLLALTAQIPYDYYWFNEGMKDLADALQQRVSASQLADRVEILNRDVNVAVREICETIANTDFSLKKNRRASTISLAFLDPNGLELQWSTVERLATLNRVDLLINFSTMGLVRNIRAAVKSRQETAVDRYFGTNEWRELFDPRARATEQRRAFIDLYMSRLERFKYKAVNPISGEVVVKNSRNAQIYTLLLLSKHPLAGKLWQIAKKEGTTLPLFGPELE